MATRLVCPRCEQQLSVVEGAPPRLTCPRCLALLVNPAVGPSDTGTAPPAVRRPPLPVIPLDRQVRRDSRATDIAVLVTSGLVVAGFVLVGTDFQLGTVGILLLILLLAAVGIGVLVIGTRGGPNPAAPPLPFPPPGMFPGGGWSPTGTGQRVLDYGWAGGRPIREPVAGWAVTVGLLGALGVCAAGFILLAATVEAQPREAHAVYLGVVIVAVIATVVAGVLLTRRPGWRGFGLGVTIGLGLGLAALGPCALCYTQTL